MSVLMAIAVLTEFAMANPQAGVVESPIEGFNYYPKSTNDDIRVSNATLRSDSLYLRSGVDKHSLIRWETANSTEEWAFSFSFNMMKLNADESAGIYLRYTDSPPLNGPFKGGESVYTGLMVGLEFSGKLVSIKYAPNEGSDHEHFAAYIGHDDVINPLRFKDVDELTMKVISTSKNLKVEIYSGDKLIYDNFRIYQVPKQGFYKPGKYFGIVANYLNVSSSKAFVLHSAQLLSRTESSEYQLFKSHIEKLDGHPRSKKDIAHHDDEIRELIHRAELVMSLVKATVGDLPNTRINTAKEEIIKDLNLLGDKIEKLPAGTKSPSRAHSLTKQLNGFDLRIKNIQRAMKELSFLVRKTTEPQEVASKHYLEYIIFAAGCLIVYILGAREIASFRATSSSTK